MNRYAVCVLVCFLVVIVGRVVLAQGPEQPVNIQPLGGAAWEGWSGLEVTPDGGQLKVPGEAKFQYPKGTRGWYDFGFARRNDGTRSWHDYYGLQLEVFVPRGRTLQLQATLQTPPFESERAEFILESKATLKVSGDGAWQRVALPWDSFDYNKSQSAFLRFIQGVGLGFRFTDDRAGDVRLRNVRLVRAPAIALDAAIRGKAVPAGGIASYQVTVGNCTDAAQDVVLSFEKHGWEKLEATVEPASLKLAPGASGTCLVSVRVPQEGVPPGGHEREKLLALSGNGGAPLAQLEFITACDAARPSIQLTPQGWQDVREKVSKYPWARQAQDEYVRSAETWNVPEVATPEQRARNSEGHPYVFANADFDRLPRVAVAWQLTRNKAYAEKVALFLRRLADEKTGYASTLAGTNMGEPQEGGNFQAVAISYDAILDSGVLSEADKQSIERMFHLFMSTFEVQLNVGNIGNWSTAANTAALFFALAMGDLAAAERYIYGPEGFVDYVTKGIMDDGWWWECSTSYNFWVAAELTQSALAVRPWGIDLLNQEFPANFSPRTIITPWGLTPPYGISFEKWGPDHRNTRSIKQLWDAVPAAADYRGIAFGMNDGHEELAAGTRLELAYYAFRDPAYATLIRKNPTRDLIYGVPELPEISATPWLNSGYAENLGYALLRSQTENRQARDQIQAVFKIGTQGGYHGHFDRDALNTIMRYGRSFWNPETIWYGYGNFMYKFYVQTSVAHNMVVVDQKMQEAVPSSQLLFHSGKMMQVVVHETNARWSDPPYGGMVYDARSSGGAVASLPALMKRTRQSFPLVTDRKWGEMGPYSDRVLQRRLGVLTDDYIVVADYLKSGQPHTFDCLYQMKAMSSFEAAGKKLIRHDAQFNPDPHSAAQFITDCDWYQAAAPAVGKFEFRFGQGADNAGTRTYFNEDGILKIDVHTLWPQQQQIMVAMPPETHGSEQWVAYDVSADGTSLAKGETGTWVLGAVNVDVPLKDQKELVVTVNADGVRMKSLFWANARLVMADGREVPVAAPAPGDNVAPRQAAGKDYYGGPIKIAGIPYDDAIPTQPADAKQPAVVRIPLSSAGAVRFKATLGGDYPFGDESQRRKVISIRSEGTQARFLTVLEPYENSAMVKSAVALSADKLRMELTDGRVQTIDIGNLEGDGKNIDVRISETRDGREVRSETTTRAGN